MQSFWRHGPAMANIYSPNGDVQPGVQELCFEDANSFDKTKRIDGVGGSVNTFGSSESSALPLNPGKTGRLTVSDVIVLSTKAKELQNQRARLNGDRDCFSAIRIAFQHDANAPEITSHSNRIAKETFKARELLLARILINVSINEVKDSLESSPLSYPSSSLSFAEMRDDCHLPVRLPVIVGTFASLWSDFTINTDLFAMVLGHRLVNDDAIVVIETSL